MLPHIVFGAKLVLSATTPPSMLWLAQYVSPSNRRADSPAASLRTLARAFLPPVPVYVAIEAQRLRCVFTLVSPTTAPHNARVHLFSSRLGRTVGRR